MKRVASFAIVLPLWVAITAAAVPARAQPTGREGPGVQAAADAREPQVLATCAHAPAPRGTSRPQMVKPDPRYRVTAIQGVVGAGARWKMIWRTHGNNADGIIGLTDGDILVAQNNNSDVLELTPAGHAKVVYRDTDTGGAVSMNKRGQLFVAERGLRASIWELAPEHKVLANRFEGGSLDCLGGVLNDLAATSEGGVYFTQGGLYYAAPDGTVRQYGDSSLQTNGIVLSPDEKTLYVTNVGSLVAFDVQPDGSLTNQRTIARLQGGGGDGMTVDAQGRLYVSAFPGYAGVLVFAADGTALGAIPAPALIASLTFGGKDKRTLFAVAQPVQPLVPHAGRSGPAGPFDPQYRIEILSIPMQAQGYLGRPK